MYFWYKRETGQIVQFCGTRHVPECQKPWCHLWLSLLNFMGKVRFVTKAAVYHLKYITKVNSETNEHTYTVSSRLGYCNALSIFICKSVNAKCNTDAQVLTWMRGREPAYTCFAYICCNILLLVLKCLVFLQKLTSLTCFHFKNQDSLSGPMFCWCSKVQNKNI